MRIISCTEQIYLYGGLNPLEATFLCGTTTFILASIGVFYAFPISWGQALDTAKMQDRFDAGFAIGNTPRVHNIMVKNESYERGYTQGFKIAAELPLPATHIATLT